MEIKHKTTIKINPYLEVNVLEEENRIVIRQADGAFINIMSFSPHDLQEIIRVVSMIKQTRRGLDFSKPVENKKKRDEIEGFISFLERLHKKK